MNKLKLDNIMIFFKFDFYEILNVSIENMNIFKNT